jgi:hypothetical protein
METGSVSTSDLVKILQEREGVKTKIAEPYQDLQITVNGPAVVLVITD